MGHIKELARKIPPKAREVFHNPKEHPSRPSTAK
jgi:hypothetical protein